MKQLSTYIALFLLLTPFISLSQTTSTPSFKIPVPVEEDLFSTDEVLDITISGNIRELLNDRGEKPAYHRITLSYRLKDSTELSVPLKAKTRGHFRKDKQNCVNPPLLLNFARKENKGGPLFTNQDKLKLVTACQGQDYVIKEWLVYKLYNLVTNNSFRARLVHVNFYDSVKKKQISTMYGILIEDDEQMAKRNQAVLIQKRKVRPESTEPHSFLKMAVFQYMIGNTDWSTQYQNIKLIAMDSLSIPICVPYDFDHAGIVEAPYALPAEELQMTSVRERRYRGYCVTDMQKFNEVVSLFNNIKTNIYGIYTNCTLLDQKYVKSTLKFLDAFYKVLNDPNDLRKEFSYPCDKNGTGNVIIKGLKE